MRLIDEQYTQTPFYGSPKMTAWRLSNPPASGLDTHFCVETLEAALSVSQPEIHRSGEPVYQLRDIRISMDGRGVAFPRSSPRAVALRAIPASRLGRVFDNIFVERLWPHPWLRPGRSVKYEELYLKNYQTTDEAYQGLEDFLSSTTLNDCTRR